MTVSNAIEEQHPQTDVFTTFDKLRVPYLTKRFPERVVWATFMFVNGTVAMTVLSLLAMVTSTPLVFPSLGPTAIVFFFTPNSPTATPRNAILGHAVGIACGYGSLCLVGLQHAPAVTLAGMDVRRLLAASLSLSLTGTLMILLRVPHPPAGATTLIISLGVITHPLHLISMEVAVTLLALQAILINRLAGLTYPYWKGERLVLPDDD